MKVIHWILFALAGWIVIIPFIARDLLQLFIRENAENVDLIQLLKWDDFFLGLAIAIIALVIVTIEQASHKTPGLRAMHWMQVLLGVWIALSPFALNLSMEGLIWSHIVSGGFVAVFALIQINEEPQLK